MAEGWRERTARCDERGELLLYQQENGDISYVDEPPIVINIADEFLHHWEPSDAGIVTIPTLNGPLTYDVVGYDLLLNSWIAIKQSE